MKWLLKNLRERVLDYIIVYLFLAGVPREVLYKHIACRSRVNSALNDTMFIRQVSEDMIGYCKLISLVARLGGSEALLPSPAMFIYSVNGWGIGLDFMPFIGNEYPCKLELRNDFYDLALDIKKQNKIALKKTYKRIKKWRQKKSKKKRRMRRRAITTLLTTGLG